jgi:hypothetical protein
MKVLLSVLHLASLRNFESLVEELSARGHSVLIAADEPEALGGAALADHLAVLPGVRWTWAPSYDDQPWFRVARKVRQGLDYLRFLEPQYDAFPKLRSRAAERAPRFVRSVLRVPGLGGRIGRRLLRRSLAAVDAGMPRHDAFERFLEAHRPDVALFASVTNPRAPQLDHLRAARALAIPTGVCVYSWDHLSSKTLIRVMPDRVYVWNETQRREAIDLHGLPDDRIVVTGAQVYDQWFDRTPSRGRETLLRDLGLPPDRALILYVCSALTPDPGEAAFVRTWIRGLRGSRDPRVREAAVVIRPHPERLREWEHIEWSDCGPVRIAGQNPVSASAKADYFDTLSHSLVVVGLVTSAFLEAAIARRPVLTITPPELRHHQEGMLHFRYLLEVEDGLLTVARTLEEHVTQIERIANGDQEWIDRQKRFLEAFVRPAGLDQPATPLFADAVEALAAVRPEGLAEVPSWQRGIARWVVSSTETGLLKGLAADAREHAEQQKRDRAVDEHRREHRAKWRRHRRRKLLTQMQWTLKRVRDRVRPAVNRPD